MLRKRKAAAVALHRRAVLRFGTRAGAARKKKAGRAPGLS
jgi:hypothetical protein